MLICYLPLSDCATPGRIFLPCSILHCLMLWVSGFVICYAVFSNINFQFVTVGFRTKSFIWVNKDFSVFYLSSGKCKSLLHWVVKLLQARFFTTYVLTSGWASLSCEVVQVFALFCNLVKRFILRIKDDFSHCPLSFPYHTEVPRLLLFGFLGFTCSILTPLILPFLLIYFALAYLVYKNQVSALNPLLPLIIILVFLFVYAVWMWVVLDKAFNL